MTSLDDAVWAILNAAADLYADSPVAAPVLAQHLTRFAEPLRVALVGPAGAGKSTLVNALVGEEIAPVAAGAFTWYQDGPARRALGYPAQGPPREVPVRGRVAGDLTDVVVDWPARDLRAATLIDTPPVGDDAVMERVWREADAVLYLVRNVPGTGLRPLRHAQDAWLTRPAPVNTILVLSRADEVGGGRIDALTSARQLARRYRREVPVRAVCQTVVAVSGLLGVAGRTLREPEFAALRTLAAVPREELAVHLLSADRFTADGVPVDLDRAVRGELLARFGLSGIRLCTTLVRTSCPTQSLLARELIRRGGLDELRECMNQLFLDRRRVLKARSALLALGSVVRADSRPGSRRLLMDLDRALANAHDFQELRLLACLRAGRTTLPAGLDQEARRLLGAAGTEIAARLGAAYEPSEEELWALGADALARWRGQTENPAFTEDQRRAARLVVRSCEGMLTELAGEPQPVG
jgi:energy-coupling factor transporter ATP-binding protein EcfA2